MDPHSVSEDFYVFGVEEETWKDVVGKGVPGRRNPRVSRVVEPITPGNRWYSREETPGPENEKRVVS